jgi:transcriptional regulator with GAF, ATPase, and Fis domain
MAKQPQLVALTGPAQGSTFALGDDEFTIGREESNSLYLVDRAVSRRQCAIRREGSAFKLRDLASTNRTAVNGLPISEHQLEHGDEIRVGGSQFRFLLEEPVINVEAGGEILDSGTTMVLRPDDAVYLRPGQLADSVLQLGSTARNLKSMLQASAAISSACDLRGLQQELMESLMQAIPAERGAILLTADSAAGFHWNFNAKADQPFHVPRSILGRVLEERVAICVNNVHLTGPNTTSESVRLSRINSMVAAPLVSGDEQLGAIYLDTLDSTVHFSDNHLQLLSGIAGVAAAPLANILRLDRLKNENRRLEAELRSGHDLVGDSDGMRDVYKFIRKTAPTSSTVLIGGESGTGKELVARAIHRNSPRAGKRCVAINCAAVTETLLESEFFGHERGAFTGAVAQRKGKLEEADGGTVFLDEIGELALALQAKLLRVLQEREFERVGGTRTIKVDIRIIAATNRDLEEMSRRGAFRQDLYYRLNVVSITLPPLRERRQDIALLANYFLQKHRAKAPRKILGLSAEAHDRLKDYDWPGNVRELENAIERAVVLGTTEEILPDDLPDIIVEAVADGGIDDAITSGGKFHEMIRIMKRQLVLKALDQANQNYPEAARLLGLHPNNLHRLMKNLNLKARK